MIDRKEGDGLSALSPTVSHGPERHVVDPSETNDSPSTRTICEEAPERKRAEYEAAARRASRGHRGEVVIGAPWNYEIEETRKIKEERQMSETQSRTIGERRVGVDFNPKGPDQRHPLRRVRQGDPSARGALHGHRGGGGLR